jgi:hypothetical protein
MKVTLLSKNALKEIKLGISLSESPDLQRLGLVETHFKLAVAELARTVLVSGGELVYGGHLSPDGYTAFLIHELQRFGRRDRPFHSVLPWAEHRKLSQFQLKEKILDLGLYGDIAGLDVNGNVIDLFKDRPEEAIPEVDNLLIKDSLTALRKYMCFNTHGRIFIGGKRHNFQGDFPGIAEEAIFAIEAKQPVFFAGGFGGVTADIARILQLDGGEWIPKYSDEPPPDPRWEKAMAKLTELRDSYGPTIHDNGLTAEEKKQLAVSHRPSEIATLVGLGLSRKLTQTAC